MNAAVESSCNSVQVGGTTFGLSNDLLFFGRCKTPRSWVVKTTMPAGIDTKVNVASLSWRVREVGPGGGINEYTRAMTRTGDVFLLRGTDVSIAPTGSATNAFSVGCTVDVSDSPAAPCLQYISQGQVTIAALGNGALIIPPFARRLLLTVSANVSAIRVNANNDAGATQSVNNVTTPAATGMREVWIPGHAIVLQIFNDDANLPCVFHGTWEIFS